MIRLKLMGENVFLNSKLKIVAGGVCCLTSNDILVVGKWHIYILLYSKSNRPS